MLAHFLLLKPYISTSLCIKTIYLGIYQKRKKHENKSHKTCQQTHERTFFGTIAYLPLYNYTFAPILTTLS